MVYEGPTAFINSRNLFPCLLAQIPEPLPDLHCGTLVAPFRVDEIQLFVGNGVAGVEPDRIEKINLRALEIPEIQIVQSPQIKCPGQFLVVAMFVQKNGSASEDGINPAQIPASGPVFPGTTCCAARETNQEQQRQNYAAYRLSPSRVELCQVTPCHISMPTTHFGGIYRRVSSAATEHHYLHTGIRVIDPADLNCKITIVPSTLGIGGGSRK